MTYLHLLREEYLDRSGPLPEVKSLPYDATLHTVVILSHNMLEAILPRHTDHWRHAAWVRIGGTWHVTYFSYTTVFGHWFEQA